VTGAGNVSGTSNTALGESADVGADNLTNATAIGADTIVTASNRVQLGRITQDTVAIGAFGTPSTSTHVCIDAFGVFTACSSSLRYKNNVKPLYTGLAFVRKLRPISFTWKGSGEHDIGFAAEDVAAVNEGFTFRNHKGEVEGVKYTQISAALVNAIKEQQAQIEALRATNAALNRRLRVLENRVLRRRRG
jgi:hypothetical protein